MVEEDEVVVGAAVVLVVLLVVVVGAAVVLVVLLVVVGAVVVGSGRGDSCVVNPPPPPPPMPWHVLQVTTRAAWSPGSGAWQSKQVVLGPWALCSRKWHDWQSALPSAWTSLQLWSPALV